MCNFDGEHILFIFYMFLGSKTHEIVLKLDECTRQSQGEDGKQFPRVIFMEMMSDIPISSQGPKGGSVQFLQ